MPAACRCSEPRNSATAGSSPIRNMPIASGATTRRAATCVVAAGTFVGEVGNAHASPDIAGDRTRRTDACRPARRPPTSARRHSPRPSTHCCRCPGRIAACSSAASVAVALGVASHALRQRPSHRAGTGRRRDQPRDDSRDAHHPDRRPSARASAFTATWATQRANGTATRSSIETSGFTNKTALAGTRHTEKLRVVERLTRTADDTITYEATVTRPGHVDRTVEGLCPADDSAGLPGVSVRVPRGQQRAAQHAERGAGRGESDRGVREEGICHLRRWHDRTTARSFLPIRRLAAASEARSCSCSCSSLLSGSLRAQQPIQHTARSHRSPRVRDARSATGHRRDREAARREGHAGRSASWPGYTQRARRARADQLSRNHRT